MRVLGRKRRWRQQVADDLELLPLMNLFIVLIPMLLLSAVFIEIRAIEMRLPGEAQSASTEEPVVITVRVREAAYVVQSPGTPDQVIARGNDGPAANAAWEQLGTALGAFVEAHPGARDVRIVAEDTTRYDVLVAVMDLARVYGLSQAGLQGEEAL